MQVKICSPLPSLAPRRITLQCGTKLLQFLVRRLKILGESAIVQKKNNFLSSDCSLKPGTLIVGN